MSKSIPYSLRLQDSLADLAELAVKVTVRAQSMFALCQKIAKRAVLAEARNAPRSVSPKPGFAQVHSAEEKNNDKDLTNYMILLYSPMVRGLAKVVGPIRGFHSRVCGKLIQIL